MANQFAMFKELGTTPADEMCPGRDINYKLSYNNLFFSAYCQEINKKRKK